MKRRLILQMGLASLAISAVPYGATALSGKSVIVVGAGIAGLSAAQALSSAGAEVTVLEANSRIGGRIHTDRSLGAPFEAGAAWIHGPSAGNPLAQMVAQHDIKTYVTEDESLTLYHPDGSDFSAADYRHFDRLEAKIDAALGELSPQSQSPNLGHALRAALGDTLDDPLSAWILSAFYEFDFGASLDQLSARYTFEDSVFPGTDVILPDGFDHLIRLLSTGLTIHTNSPVQSIAQSETGVSVDGRAADYAVVCVPLGVLKAGHIRFSPALPTPLQAAIERLGFGTVTKIALKFDRPFWDIGSQYFGLLTPRDAPRGRWPYWINYRRFSQENILLGLCFGDYAHHADAMDDAALQDDALAMLSRVWGTDIPTPTAMLRTAWSQDRLFQGTYSYTRQDSTPAHYKAFTGRPSGRVLWAGEHTHFAYHGTAHGALMSGQRAAKTLIAT